MAVLPKPSIPQTKHQKGRMWATMTLVICGTFSLYANVLSGSFNRNSVIVSALPPVVAFLSSHLISYFNPKTIWTKATVYGGFGLISLIAMYGSGYHIVEFVMHTGQPWTTAISYVFITDAPMLLSAGILISKVSTSQKATETAKPVQAAIPAKKTTPAKVAKTAIPKVSSAKPRTTTKPVIPAFKAAVVDETAQVA